MKRIAFFTTAFAAFLLTANIALSQAKTPIEGVWKITEWIEHGDTNTNPQPGLIFFTKGYYSVAIVMAPRGELTKPERGRTLSDSEKIQRFEYWKWFVGISGTYEFKGSTAILRPIVAKDAFDMTVGEPEIKFEGSNAFWLIPGGAARNAGFRMKLTRLE